ncbi:MAG: DNA primase, partial [Harvfovirus sp.]
VVNDILTTLDQGQIATAKYYHKMRKDDVVFTDDKIYRFNKNSMIWEKINNLEMLTEIAQFIEKLLTDGLSACTNAERRLLYSKALPKYTHSKYVEGVFKYLYALFLDPLFIKKLDSAKHLLSFRNGEYDLSKGLFRERKREDYISKCLEIDYMDPDPKITVAVQDILLKISNTDNELYQFHLAWLGYCLTGETKEQKFLMVIGHTAQNGKSTMAKMFSKSLPIYSVKLNNKTFNKNYAKAHKQFAKILNARFVYLEELDRSMLDADLLKDFVDGDKIGSNEIVYGTAADIILYAKILITSNKNFIADVDEGLMRRGLVSELINRFLSKVMFDEATNKKGIYLLDNTLIEKFDSAEYQLAFIYILLPFAKQYYEKGLSVPKIIIKQFRDMCDENDTMSEFLRNHFVITHDNADLIHKDDFTGLYNEVYKKKVTWTFLLSDIKRKNITYDRTKKSRGMQGCLMGIKKKAIFDNSDSEEENESPCKIKATVNLFERDDKIEDLHELGFE